MREYYSNFLKYFQSKKNCLHCANVNICYAIKCNFFSEVSEFYNMYQSTLPGWGKKNQSVSPDCY